MSPEEIHRRLRTALLLAMKAKDAVATSALRSAMAAIGNAEAVAAPAVPPAAGDAHVAGSASGLGATEARRRALTGDDLIAIIEAEAGERRAAASAYEALDDADRARRLRREADIVASIIEGS